MIHKILSIFRVFYYHLRYSNRIHFSGPVTVHRNVKVNIYQGQVHLGKGVTLKPGTYFSILNHGKLTINDCVYIGRNCTITCHDAISVGAKCGFGPNVTIYDHDHRFGSSGPEEGFRTAPVTIGNNCWIGAGVIILRGCVIGDGCVIGAGCVVSGHIPPYSVVTSGRELIITPLEKRGHNR